MRDEAKYSP